MIQSYKILDHLEKLLFFSSGLHLVDREIGRLRLLALLMQEGGYKTRTIIKKFSR